MEINGYEMEDHQSQEFQLRLMINGKKQSLIHCAVTKMKGVPLVITITDTLISELRENRLKTFENTRSGKRTGKTRSPSHSTNQRSIIRCKRVGQSQ